MNPVAQRWARRALGIAAAVAVLALPAPLGTALLLLVTGAGAALAARRAWPRLRSALTGGRGARPAPGAVLLGRDTSGRPVGLSDDQLAAHALIVGATGAGKSTTLLSILSDRIARGRPVIAIDMKGSPAFRAALEAAAAQAGRGIRVWTPDGKTHWNPLAHGNATELKDKLISAERFSEPHYQRAAERYLQTALQVAQAVHPARPPRFDEVVALMDPARLSAAGDRAPPPLRDRVHRYLGGLTRDQESAAAGLGTRLALLAESAAGPYLLPGRDPAAEIDLGSALRGGDVVLFSLNSSTYGRLAAQLGALAIQDLTSAAGRRLTAGDHTPATIAVDEFSALGADNMLSLLARGREAGAGVLLATQELSDLERAGRGFRDQVLGITAVKLAHRQEVDASARVISQLAGTKIGWRETRTVQRFGARPSATRGSRHQVEEPVVHPNDIKRLGTGELIMFTNVPAPRVAQVRVIPPPPAPPAGPRGSSAAATGVPTVTPPRRSGKQRGSGGPDPSHHRPPERDQPAPGVTR